jgi:serine protease Do
MIRRTLPQIQAATFAILLPNPNADGMPTPAGTGFFVSKDGWLVTAAHVIETAEGEARDDLDEAWLQKEPQEAGFSPTYQSLRLDYLNKDADIALIKTDIQEGRGEIHPAPVSARTLEEGEPVYGFGYPLSSGSLAHRNQGITIGTITLRPRTTSAIVASTLEESGFMTEVGGTPNHYVLDKALNYGNSGGPIVCVETGRVHAICSRFQPVTVRQNHVTLAGGKPLDIHIPSLYGVVSNLTQPSMLEDFAQRGIALES